MQPESKSMENNSLRMNRAQNNTSEQKHASEDKMSHMRNAFEDKIKQIRSALAYWYFQWELVSCMYVMDPAERVIFGAIVCVVFSILLYAAFNYIPAHVIAIWTFFSSVVINNNDLH